MQPSSAFRLGRALREAITGTGGEVVIRAGETVGRIYVHAGSIAWAYLSTEHGSLRDFLVPSKDALSTQQLHALVDEARRSGKGLTDTLVEHGLAERAEVREREAEWIRHRIEVMARMKKADVIFIPEARRYSGDMLFAPAEVIPSALWQSVNRTPLPRQAARREEPASPPSSMPIEDCLAEALKIEGARKAALYDAVTGHCFGARGEPIDAAAVRAHMKSIVALGASGAVEDVVITAASVFHVIRALGSSPRYYFYLELQRVGVTIALARHKLGLLAVRAASGDAPAMSVPPTVKSSGT